MSESEHSPEAPFPRSAFRRNVGAGAVATAAIAGCQRGQPQAQQGPDAAGAHVVDFIARRLGAV
jgi:hypothetical protein